MENRKNVPPIIRSPPAARELFCGRSRAREEGEARGISERFLPISVGIENVKDPIADLEQAFGTTNNE